METTTGVDDPQPMSVALPSTVLPEAENDPLEEIKGQPKQPLELSTLRTFPDVSLSSSRRLTLITTFKKFQLVNYSSLGSLVLQSTSFAIHHPEPYFLILDHQAANNYAAFCEITAVASLA